MNKAIVYLSALNTKKILNINQQKLDEYNIKFNNDINKYYIDKPILKKTRINNYNDFKIYIYLNALNNGKIKNPSKDKLEEYQILYNNEKNKWISNIYT